MDGKKFPSIGTPLCGLIFGIVGALIALMLLYMGFGAPCLWRFCLRRDISWERPPTSRKP